MNSLGGFAAFGSQVFFGWFGQWRTGLGYLGRDKWDPAFYVYAAVYAIGAVLWLFIDASRSIVEREAESKKLHSASPADPDTAHQAP